MSSSVVRSSFSGVTNSPTAAPLIDATLERDGFLLLSQLLTAAAVERARVAVEDVLAQGTGACERPNNTLVPLRWNDSLVAAMRDRPEQVTFSLRAGDAILMDYRLLHGTHANTSARRRDCVLLNFASDWRGLPADIRGHLISHSALPGPGETRPTTGVMADLLPAFDGPRRDLELNRTAPAHFVATD